MKGRRNYVCKRPFKRRRKSSSRVKGRNHFYKGYRMASGAEVHFARTCDKRKLAWEYEADVLLWLPPPATYKPDFKFTRNDGTVFYVEYKGYLRGGDKRKMIEIKKQHPDLDIRFVFEDPGKPVAGARARTDGTKMTHGEWAEKHGYKWADREMPDSWTKGVE